MCKCACVCVHMNAVSRVMQATLICVLITNFLSPSFQSVRTFFRKNMETCLEWLTHVRGYIVSIAIHAGMPAVAIRHGFAALQDFEKVPNVKMVGFSVCH